jgi:hypothetical protein
VQITRRKEIPENRREIAVVDVVRLCRGGEEIGRIQQCQLRHHGGHRLGGQIGKLDAAPAQTGQQLFLRPELAVYEGSQLQAAIGTSLRSLPECQPHGFTGRIGRGGAAEIHDGYPGRRTGAARQNRQRQQQASQTAPGRPRRGGWAGAARCVSGIHGAQVNWSSGAAGHRKMPCKYLHALLAL